MHLRCREDYKQSKDYFHRGIKICDQWASYEHFLADMGERPEKTTIDLIDNDKGYDPDNCRWATSSVQRSNCRRVNFIEHDGKTKILKDAAVDIGVTDTAVYQQASRAGVSLQDAFNSVAARRAA